MPESKFREIKFTDKDVVNLDEAPWECGCGNNHAWLLHDHGFTIAVVFAETEQEALDVAADKNLLDRYLITDVEMPDYENREMGITYLGNSCREFDIESLGREQLPGVRLSYCALFNAREAP